MPAIPAEVKFIDAQISIFSPVEVTCVDIPMAKPPIPASAFRLNLFPEFLHHIL
jgi:hypothetical protein